MTFDELAPYQILLLLIIIVVIFFCLFGANGAIRLFRES